MSFAITPPMHASGMMHMLDAPWVTLSQLYAWASPGSLLGHGSKQGSTWLHYGCWPALPSITQTVPLNSASAPFQLTYMWAYQYHSYGYNDLQSFIQVPSFAAAWPKLQIQDCCLFPWPVGSDPSTRVATWRSSGRSCGSSGPPGNAGCTLWYVSRTLYFIVFNFPLWTSRDCEILHMMWIDSRDSSCDHETFVL